MRLLVLTLLLLNGLYFVWGQGWLQSFGFGPAVQREPFRLAQQIKPEALILIHDLNLVPVKVVKAELANSVCLQSGVLDEAQANALRRVLQAALEEASWTLDSVVIPARWIIYMGKYANAAELAKKRAQLASLRLNFGVLDNPALTPGLSLGAYPTQAQANAALEALVLRGVRTARVLQEWPASKGYRLRLPAVDDALQKQLAPVRAALPARPLLVCPVPVAAP